MNINWKVVFREGILTGTLFCIAILAYLRISPALSAKDYPIVTKTEILALTDYAPDLYEQLLSTILVFIPMIWGVTRILTKLDVDLQNLPFTKRFFNLYLGLFVWVFIIFNMDLILIDWLIICFLKAPISGVEHLLSNEAIKSYQSYSFHFREHYLFYGAYLVNLLFPIIIILIYTFFKGIRNRFSLNK